MPPQAPPRAHTPDCTPNVIARMFAQATVNWDPKKQPFAVYFKHKQQAIQWLNAHTACLTAKQKVRLLAIPGGQIPGIDKQQVAQDGANAVVNGTTDAVTDAVSAPLDWLKKLVDVQTWIRVGLVVAGAVLIFLALRMLFRNLESGARRAKLA